MPSHPIVATRPSKRSVIRDGCRGATSSLALTAGLCLLTVAAVSAQEMGERFGTQAAATDALSRSVHRNLGCRSCHSEMSFEMWMRRRPDPIGVCSRCHVQQGQALFADGHWMALSAGNAKAPTCVSCHGSHGVLSRMDPASPTHPTNVPGECGTCHGPSLDTYRQGIHASELEQAGNLRAATCTSCHTAHNVARAVLQWSTVAPRRVAATCAACHLEAGLQYSSSVHAIAAARGAPHAGTCVDCHGGHSIPRATAPSSPTSVLQVSGATCSRCHESVSLTEMHRLPASVVADYRGSFHGLAGALGDRRVANCASCHGYHEVRPSWDPKSRISPSNLSTTCGQCHVGATPGFARGGIHHLPRTLGHRLVDLTRVMYQMMIVGIIGLMLLHNGLDFVRRLKNRARARKAVAELVVATAAHRTYLRFTRNECAQHWLLASSFIALAVTGFMLTMGWNLPWVSGQTSATLRAGAHRVAAAVLMAVGVYHLGYLTMTARGRQIIRDMVPRLTRPANLLCCAASCLRCGPPSTTDWRDLMQTVKYNLGLSSKRPQSGRFTYAEKMEYFALVWGTIVMVVTGSALWFEVPFLNRFPFWSFQLATVVHYYEAILATLAIVVWHFYFTVFSPDVFPIAKTMITGRITREEMEREHPRELCAIDCAEDEQLQPPARVEPD